MLNVLAYSNSGLPRGTEEYLNVMGKVDIINNTLGKALGGAAGTNVYVTVH
jgi:7-keto-8-aminopelargonate synthetase-like enzyme